MCVRVNDAGHDVGAVCIDFARRIAGPCVFLYFESRVADRHYVGNAVALDNDVDRPDRWCAGAVNERCAADDEAIVRDRRPRHGRVPGSFAVLRPAPVLAGRLEISVRRYRGVLLILVTEASPIER